MTLSTTTGFSAVAGARPARRLAMAAAASLYALLVLGSVARIIGAAAACGANPLLCNGSLLPSADVLPIVAFAYRLLALLTLALTLAAGLAGLRAWVSAPRAARAARAALLLLGAFGVSAFVAWNAYEPVASAARVGTALLLLAALLVAGTVAEREGPHQPVKAAQARYRRLLLWSAGALFALLVVGAYAATSGGKIGLLSASQPQALHNYAALGAGALLAFVIWRTARTRWHSRAVRFASITSGASFVGQGLVGAASVLLAWPPLAASLHQAFGLAAWVGLVALVSAAWDVPAAQRVPAEAPAWRQTLDDYIKLTKPGVISLLLVTTLATMYIAGEPSLMLVLVTMVGGYLMAGGANAINCYIDRDVDVLMGRTARRPIPSNRIEPTHALVFGVALGALSFALFVLYVNLLSAALSLFALLFYVIVYTGWLKRNSTQNIVIGGAAGCFPPMIGWAAVTNQLSLMPLLLFLIIFYWTPPHFWALALIRRDDYARAGIPMLPVVQGERSTKQQILLYSVIMIVITLLPFLFRFLGPIYLAGALVLGAIFMRDAVRLWRESGTGSAWRLYKYSLLYLALLFAAMVLDAVVMRAFA
jgi:protoheme IX farnesyltransferase